jgi:hypothetical protein
MSNIKVLSGCVLVSVVVVFGVLAVSDKLDNDEKEARRAMGPKIDPRALMAQSVMNQATAPDLDLERLDGKGRVRLTEAAKDRPIVLVFSSFG